jgi:hypothetical protein
MMATGPQVLIHHNHDFIRQREDPDAFLPGTAEVDTSIKGSLQRCHFMVHVDRSFLVLFLTLAIE